MGCRIVRRKVFWFFFSKKNIFFLFPLLLAADFRPVLFPVRDVTVDYDIRPAGQPARDAEVAIAAGGVRLRVISPDLPTTFFVDRRAGTAAIALPFLRMYSVVKIGDADVERTVLRNAAFSRGGERRIAGLACTEWHAVSPQGTAEGCLTDDGVLLAGSAVSKRRGALGEVRARRVSYGPIDPADLVVPPDFHEAHVRLDVNGMPQ